ncbi:hypothetical protein MRB53_023117 [Persea americana]|uniref:Uncharacterized protein n=1 Tax=Persea americana TaxID=3435 RepID=A0ACC2L8K8_PERAE|nr:hypothetical protein MRB53_023117 [Persea americana]
MLSSDSISPPFEGFSLQPPEHADGAKFQAQLFESEHADGTKLQAQLASPLESEFNSKEDLASMVSQIPLLMDSRKKLLLQSCSAGHLTAKCPFTFKRGLLRVPAPASIETPGNAKDKVSTNALDGEPGHLPFLPSDALVNPANSRKALVTTVVVSDVNTEKEGNQGLSSAPLSEVVDPKAIVFESSDNASMASMATLESNQESSPAIPSD